MSFVFVTSTGCTSAFRPWRGSLLPRIQDHSRSGWPRPHPLLRLRAQGQSAANVAAGSKDNSNLSLYVLSRKFHSVFSFRFLSNVLSQERPYNNPDEDKFPDLRVLQLSPQFPDFCQVIRNVFEAQIKKRLPFG